MAPTNLPPQARAKWAKTLEARNPKEKLKALEDFLSSIPTHKGTSKLRAHVKHQIAVLRGLVEEEKRRGRRGGGGSPFSLKKEGDVQVVLLGYTLAGKSSILRALTNAKPEVSGRPYTTERPIPGMMLYEGVKFQIIDTPPLKGLEHDAPTLSLARGADALLLIVDLATDPLAQLSNMIEELASVSIVVEKPKSNIEIERCSSGGVKVLVMGKLIDTNEKEIVKLMNDYGVRHALVKIYGETSLDDVENALLHKPVFKPAIVLANKADLPDVEDKLKMLKDRMPFNLPLITTSTKLGLGREDVGRELWRVLDVIRVYTKEPSKPPSNEPLVIKRGATIVDVAERIHKQLKLGFKYAKVWSSRLPFPQRVGPSFILEDGDVVEIRAE